MGNLGEKTLNDGIRSYLVISINPRIWYTPVPEVGIHYIIH